MVQTAAYPLTPSLLSRMNSEVACSPSLILLDNSRHTSAPNATQHSSKGRIQKTLDSLTTTIF
ncbi:hypothetical protein E2C01_000195 [Portunus trituberculatus]|uniref:Uncharacterized protein n=1 Tax=Portunus trituberculatus TaxID=210409 RepID=A0A5B7CFW7_PORTR|nr:hypothetical protein [Portunus trituberculatus]